MKAYFKICLLLGTILFLDISTYAQHHTEDSHAHENAHEHHLHKHHLAIFNGVTTNFKHDETGYAIGLDYEYRFSQKLGITVLAEYINFSPEEIVVGGGILYHVHKGLKFIAAPIALFTEPDHQDAHSSEGEKNGKEASFAFRIGTAYAFHVGNFSIVPLLNWDAGKAKDLSYGVAIGFGF